MAFLAGGSLATKIRQNQKAGLVFSESDLKKLLTHVSLVSITKPLACV